MFPLVIRKLVPAGTLPVAELPVLLSGHHAEIEKWRLKQALGRTWQRRPDLLAQRQLTKQEARLLAEYQQEQASVQQEETK